MSCRVIGRTAEQLLFRRVLELARDAGVRFLEGEYRGTKKNGLVSALYSDLGFECSRQDGEQATYLLDLNGTSPPQTFVRPE
jgi:predicted enzyme involved in methoxymalonyl-ACP biosynthesis